MDNKNRGVKCVVGKLDYSEGRVFLLDGDWMLDAEPHVTTLFERLFPGTQTKWVNKYF